MYNNRITDEQNFYAIWNVTHNNHVDLSYEKGVELINFLLKSINKNMDTPLEIEITSGLTSLDADIKKAKRLLENREHDFSGLPPEVKNVIKRMAASGRSQNSIANELGISRTTVRNYC